MYYLLFKKTIRKGRKTVAGIIKFGNHERKRVFERLEKLRSVKLNPVGRSKTFLKGSDRSYYCVLGGTDDWHGIPKETMEHCKKDCANVYLVIARWLRTKIEIYMGSMKPLVDGRGSLTHTKQGDFHFDLKTPTDGILSIQQVPGAKLSKIDEFVDPFSYFKMLPEEEQRECLAAAKSKGK